MAKKALIITLSIFLVLFAFWFFYLRTAQTDSLIEQGNSIVQKIEKYKTEYNKLPNSLEDIGIPVVSEIDPPLYYEKRDSIHYTVAFSTSPDNSKIYYSDSRKWENSYRKMK